MPFAVSIFPLISFKRSKPIIPSKVVSPGKMKKAVVLLNILILHLFFIKLDPLIVFTENALLSWVFPLISGKSFM